MKKKLLLTLTFLFAFTAVTNVKALKAQAPKDSAIPEANTVLDAILDEKFDFSKVKFGETAGRAEMRKIFLTTTANPDGTTIEEKLGSNWFSTYCLDGSLKYPIHSFTNSNYATAANDTVKTDYIIQMGLYSNPKFRTLFESAKGYSMTTEFDYEANATFVSDFEAGNEATIKINKITYTNSALAQKVITGAELNEAEGKTGEQYVLTVKKADVMFDKYTTEAYDNVNYNRALWIVEHSYPTLTIAESLAVAGTTQEAVLADIKTLHEGETHTDEEWNDILENYIYSTVQYAIWKSQGIKLVGSEIAGAITNSAELDKLYQFLIMDRDEYENYDKLTFDNKVELTKPEAGKEIYKETKEYYIYGPYTINYSLLSVTDVNIQLTQGDPKNVSLVDADGNSITAVANVKPGTQYFIKCLKAGKVTNVSIKLDAKGKTFHPNVNRGRIYYSYYPLAQNVISGGKIDTVDLNETFDFMFNPKTGVENIAILFVVTLAAFAIGYIVLSKKNKPIELN